MSNVVVISKGYKITHLPLAAREMLGSAQYLAQLACQTEHST